MAYDFPPDFFDPPDERPASWVPNPHVRTALDWMLSLLPAGDWHRRRVAVATQLFDAALGRPADAKGKLYNHRDSFGWYLFLAEASLDHFGNYDPIYGSRVVPVFEAIGRQIDAIRGIEGAEERLRRALTNDRAQPNGTLFELLVAAAYARAGGAVRFVTPTPESPTHEFDVLIRGIEYAVECKRMETGEYGEMERERMRMLARPCMELIERARISTLGNFEFFVPLEQVPADHLAALTRRYLASGREDFRWEGQVSAGSLGRMDLGPLQEVLKTEFLLIGATRAQELMSGRYERNQAFLHGARVEMADNPRYVSACDFAVLLQWQSNSDRAIGGKARDVMRSLSEANEQLPRDRRSIVHIGFEAVEGDLVERKRAAKIEASTARFDPLGKRLEYAYYHYLVPEAPPDQLWAYDETTQVFSIRPEGPPPLDGPFLVLSEDAETRPGGHWS